MKSFILACKTFFKALKDAAGAQKFLAGGQTDTKIEAENSPHLRLLALLQKEGRLIDFLKEDISSFSDAQIGSAMRKIHGECSKTLEEFVTVRPFFQESEGSKITVSQGYNTQAIKVIGKVKGEPPYVGILRHKGWVAHKLSLPTSLHPSDCSVISPAEVEING